MEQHPGYGEVIPHRRKRNPWVLVGACATGAVLLGGLVAFKNGKAMMAQQFMRARVVAQGITVAIMVSSGGYLALDAAKERAVMAAQNTPVPRP